MILCFSLSFLSVNEFHIAFGFVVGHNRTLKKRLVHSKNYNAHFSPFLTFYRLINWERSCQPDKSVMKLIVGVLHKWQMETEYQTHSPDRHEYHRSSLFPLEWLVGYLDVTQATVGFIYMEQNAYKLLSGEHKKQQGMLINNSKLSLYRAPGLALSKMYCRLWSTGFGVRYLAIKV